ncbi:MAG: cytochrome c biogenesis protein [Nitrospinota bacterium]
MINFFSRAIPALHIIFAIVAIVLFPISFWAVLDFAPTESFMGLPQKIFYYHVPIALFCIFSFFITFVASIGFLVTKNFIYDSIAFVATEIGMLLGTLILITGVFWAKPVWGVWWTWDPRLTTTLVLWLIFAGYLVLRAQVPDRQRRGLYSAIIGIVGFVDVPLVHFSVKLWSRGIHPPKPVLHPDMAIALKVAFIATASLFILIFLLRLRVELLTNRVETFTKAKSFECR